VEVVEVDIVANDCWAETDERGGEVEVVLAV
jgi:hypothetical protein